MLLSREKQHCGCETCHSPTGRDMQSVLNPLQGPKSSNRSVCRRNPLDRFLLQDACTLSYLGQDTELYGRQRMFGSLGWGLAIFIVATILGNQWRSRRAALN